MGRGLDDEGKMMAKPLMAAACVFATLLLLLLFGCTREYSGMAKNGTNLPEPPSPPFGVSKSDGAPGRAGQAVQPVAPVAKKQNVSVSPLPPKPAKPAPEPLVNVSGYPATNANQKLIKEVVGSFDGNDDATLDAVRKISALGLSAIDDLLPLLRKENIYEQWTALEALGPIIPRADNAQKEKIRQELLPLLSDKKASVRTYAAFSLLYLGEKDALPVMISSLSITDRLFASEPPVQICEVADAALVLHTGQDFGFTCNQYAYDAAAKKKWENWWLANKGKIKFDGETKKFSGG